MSKNWLYVVAAVALLGRPAAADVWDVQGDNDDGTGSDNELIHGTSQIHDLGVRPGPIADLDYFRIGQQPFSSYEVVIDGTSGDIGFNSSILQRMATDGTTVIQTAVGQAPILGYSRTLRWANNTSAIVSNEFIRVGPGSCGTSCDSADVYHIRAIETTISVARFNNAGSQVTVLLIQNTSNVPVAETTFYWNTSGTLLGTSSTTLGPKALSVFPLTSFPALVGQGGSITITHDGSYGGLNVKTVALEPSTGFSFDTPGVYIGD
jgi:hypothetical protein